MVESAHTIVHVRLGSRTGQAPVRFGSAFGNHETILILVGELAIEESPALRFEHRITPADSVWSRNGLTGMKNK